MKFRNALHIAIDNFSSTYKLLLYRIITSVISFSLIFVILRMGLDFIVKSAELGAIRSLIGEFFRAVATGDSVRLQTFQGDFHAAITDFTSLLGMHISGIVWSIVGVCLIYLITRFANGLAVFAVASTLNDRMSVYSRTKFSAAFFKNIGRATLYQLIYVPLCFVYDALTITACWFFFFFVPSFLPSWGVLSIVIAVSLTLTVMAILQALKMAFISSWMPAIIAGGQSVAQGMRTSFRSVKNFGRRFSSFLVAIYIIAVLNVVFGIVTFGSALLLTVPFSFLILLCLQFVYYYADTNRKFFISYKKIVGGENEGPDGLES